MKKYTITDCNGNKLGDGHTLELAVLNTACNINESGDWVEKQLDSKQYTGDETTLCLVVTP